MLRSCYSHPDYASAGKPVCDYEDPAARAALVDALAVDAHGCLGVLTGRQLPAEVARAGELLATVVGQDLEENDEGIFRIARRVAADRVISTVDPEARHGRKSFAHGFDGYKGHVGIDPDSEIITATTVTAGNTGDVGSAAALLAEDLPVGPNADPHGDAFDARPRRCRRRGCGGAADRLRRLGLRSRRAARDAGGGAGSDRLQGAATVGTGWNVRQGAVHRRSASGHGRLPGWSRCPAQAGRIRRPDGLLRPSCASCPLATQREERPDHQRRSL